MLHKSGDHYRFWSRHAREWTASYGSIGDWLSATDDINAGVGTLTPRLHAGFASHVVDCILDGEMMAYNSLTDRLEPKTFGFDVKRRCRLTAASLVGRGCQNGCDDNIIKKDGDCVPEKGTSSVLNLPSLYNDNDQEPSQLMPCFVAFDILYLNGEVNFSYRLNCLYYLNLEPILKR
ncbi:unnamed protein product [Protopolystoma xenopodis]|uniref:ATP-dependent DNA ligase family profile domain-containing protein n=1 Tax=Protopolystoma xenopodis TaxID=117903 RepID=A0A448XH27_9PLAT|nr:unnamed protein product [Protopolystoma xenopodis]